MICAPENSFCISKDYRIYVFGNNERLKSDNYNSTHIPELIKGTFDIKMIDCGIEHILCLDFNGSVFSFGNNDYGQLGLGKDPNELKKISIPQKINIPLCKQIACDGFFSLCLIEKDLLYSFGYNTSGQLGLDNSNEYYNSPQLIPDLHNVEYIACGHDHIICKTYDNTYYGWGSNFYGQIGHVIFVDHKKPTLCNNFPENIISIKCSRSHTLLLTLEGNIYSFGDNHKGQLGLNSTLKKTNMPTLIINIPEIRRIECGYYHSMCIDVNGNLWVFGENNDGQLGLDDTEPRYKPIKHPILSNVIDI